jgi:hypothetical protein
MRAGPWRCRPGRPRLAAKGRVRIAQAGYCGYFLTDGKVRGRLLATRRVMLTPLGGEQYESNRLVPTRAPGCGA